MNEGSSMPDRSAADSSAPAGSPVASLPATSVADTTQGRGDDGPTVLMRDLVDRLDALRTRSIDYHPATGDEAVWSCQIGGSFPHGGLPDCADNPMREAVQAAYEALTGSPDGYTFSGWGGQLDESHRAVVEHREPVYKRTDWALLKEAADTIEALSNHCQLAWGLIANAQHGNWADAAPGWRMAAASWRDEWHALLTEQVGQ